MILKLDITLGLLLFELELKLSYNKTFNDGLCTLGKKVFLLSVIITLL